MRLRACSRNRKRRKERKRVEAFLPDSPRYRRGTEKKMIEESLASSL